MPEEGEKVTAFLGAELGGMITGLYGIVQWIDDAGEQRIGIVSAPGQTFVVSQGLLTIANAVADSELTTYVMDAAAEGNSDGG